MQHHHVCVWIDHRVARIIGIGHENPDLMTIKSGEPSRKIHRKADHVGLATEPLDPEFMETIARHILAAGAILLVGPGRAKIDLATYLHRKYPAASRNVWGVEPMDDITDSQLAAAARHYFRNAGRMHG